jgi:uncharacterized protein with HEPN domain
MIDERVALTLDNMRRAAEDAISFVDGVAEQDFIASAQLQKACAMCLLIIGEAASRIEQKSPDFVADHPDWPWTNIRGLRNRIAHDYFSLDIPIVWKIVQESLPDLLTKIKAIGELDPRLWPKS